MTTRRGTDAWRAELAVGTGTHGPIVTHGQEPQVKWHTLAKQTLPLQAKSRYASYASHPKLVQSPSSSAPAWRALGPAVSGLAARAGETGRPREECLDRKRTQDPYLRDLTGPLAAERTQGLTS